MALDTSRYLLSCKIVATPYLPLLPATARTSPLSTSFHIRCSAVRGCYARLAMSPSSRYICFVKVGELDARGLPHGRCSLLSLLSWSRTYHRPSRQSFWPSDTTTFTESLAMATPQKHKENTAPHHIHVNPLISLTTTLRLMSSEAYWIVRSSTITDGTREKCCKLDTEKGETESTTVKTEDALGGVAKFQGLHHGLLHFLDHLRPLFRPTYPPRTLTTGVASWRHLAFMIFAPVLNVVLTLEATTARPDHLCIRGQPRFQPDPSPNKTLQRGQEGLVFRFREQGLRLHPHREGL